MDFQELKAKSKRKVLLRGKSGRGKTYRACRIALYVASKGGRVLYVDTEAEGSTTLVDLVEDGDTQFTAEDVENIEYIQAENYNQLKQAIGEGNDNQDKFDLIVVDTLDHKHSYVLKHVTDAKKDSDADWNQYARIYSEEKELMELIGKPDTNIIATLDPDSGSMDKPKGAQTNIHGYFEIVLDLVKDGDEWAHKVRNWVNMGDAVGKKIPGVDERLAGEIIDRTDVDN
jgi:hypothetical protein